jgi:hypothetical protein
MKEETMNRLIEKYKNGETSLEEEEKLFYNVNEDELEIKALADFIHNHQIKTPQNLNEKLWKSFDEKKVKKNNFKITFFSVAASIVLIVSLYVGNLDRNKLSNGEKQALLNEAKNMFVDVEVPKTVHHIILESDLIVLYTKSDK